MSLKIKALTIIGVSILFIFFVFNLIVMRDMLVLVQDEEYNQYEMLTNTVYSKFERIIKDTRTSILMIANNEEIKRLLQKGIERYIFLVMDFSL